MLIRRMYLPIKRECVAFIFQYFSLSLFTEIRKETLSIKEWKNEREYGKIIFNIFKKENLCIIFGILMT